MSHQLSSEEQLEKIKSFFAKRWKIMVAIVVIGLLAFYGWRYWQSYKTEKAIEYSDKYEQLIAELDDAKTDSVNELVSFAKDNDTIYGVFASLRAAKFYVEVLKDYHGAQELLVDALKKTDSEPIKTIINIRIARLQYQQGQYQESLTSLSHINNESWGAVINDLRGDVFVKMTHYADAVDAYNVALTSSPTPDLEEIIKMKLNQAEYLKAKQQVEQEAQAAKEKAEQEAKEKQATEESKN
ncbi:tetratricopeptide repeat protein [Gilliamella sp. Pra-s65]|uniref:tetratricopeptide repeat protein n=1 Tax=unclassified Gilliamella TaxID=2685620 RepID=UPI001365DAA9|nr:tetratricopeptide repeat protein [Gilliamella sp. Pra-s65]MWP73440.1 tetratricopeptide repeat protein [Gilliamella sp. Pra-s52]